MSISNFDRTANFLSFQTFPQHLSF